MLPGLLEEGVGAEGRPHASCDFLQLGLREYADHLPRNVFCSGLCKQAPAPRNAQGLQHEPSNGQEGLILHL